LRTLNEFAWKYVEPIFNAKKMAWVCSPWISKSYAEKLYDLSRKGVEVRIITSDDEYNADTFSYLSQLLPRDSKTQSTNFDVHFIKKEIVHSKIYVIDENYAVTGAVNFTYSGLIKQTNNFTIAENQEVEAIKNDFMRLWIGFKSENVRPTQSTLKDVLPIIPYEKAVLPEIKNWRILDTTSAKLTINPYYKIQYSLLENVRLPWYQQKVVEDNGTVIIDASNGEVLNCNESENHTKSVIIRDLSNISPLKESVLETSEEYEVENREWDVKVDCYKAEKLAINYIMEKNRRNIPYNDRYEGQKYQSYVPSYRAITIRSTDLRLVPTWHFEYAFKDRNFEKTLLASSGEILQSSFHMNGAICEDCGRSITEQRTWQCPNCFKLLCPSEISRCSSCQRTIHKEDLPKTRSFKNEILCNKCLTICEDCGKAISKREAWRCPNCSKWICPSELVVCSSCQRTFHKEHIDKTCSICNQILCAECVTTCPVCKREHGKNHLVNCSDCGLALCSKCIITSGLIMKKSRCPSCDIQKQEKKNTKFHLKKR
jgi:HKD family nuclease